MGIKHFFPWFKNHHSDGISNIQKNRLIPVDVDNFCLDLNGIFHDCAQKIYRYGNYKEKSLLRPPFKPNQDTERKLFEEITKTISTLTSFVKPKRRLILCVDGVAGTGKMMQQRQRRWLSSLSPNQNFETASISPGTKFMDHLSKYIDWYLRSKMSMGIWKHLEVVFSNEKAVGEGEHGILSFIRKFTTKEESFMIYGLDADLIMLALGSHYPTCYILRDLYLSETEFVLVDISKIRNTICENLFWEGMNPEICIDDFILICFLIGNDFLPSIPGLEVPRNGLDIIISSYLTTVKSSGHLTKKVGKNTVFDISGLSMFFEILGRYEKENLEDKINVGDYFKDDLLEKHTTVCNGRSSLNLEAYREDYYLTKMDGKDLRSEYLFGLQWILSYYLHGMPDWKWFYNGYYAPFARDLAISLKTFTFRGFTKSSPLPPFLQLLLILPPKSSHLLPEPLADLMTSTDSPLKHLYPDEFEVDLSGKIKDWEGIALLPSPDVSLVREAYLNELVKVDPRDQKRNIIGKSFVYHFNSYNTYEFISYYGKIPYCKVKIDTLDI